MLTLEQQTIVNSFDTNMLINAAPGSGKTFTLITQAQNYVKANPNKLCLILCYNTKIAKEINAKVNHPNIYCFTLHTIGNAILKSWTKRNKVFKPNKFLQFNRDKKNVAAFKKLVQPKTECYSLLRQNTLQLLRFARYTLIDPTDQQALYELAIKLQLPLIGNELSLTSQLHDLNINQFTTCGWSDFDDMLYLPEYLELTLQSGDIIGSGDTTRTFDRPFDFILCDEAQDFSKLMQNAISRLSHENTIFAFYGDSRQAINLHNGSDPYSFSNLGDKYDCVELPLTTIFRCPKNHVQKLNEVFNTNYIAFKQNDGLISDIPEDDIVSLVKPNSAILGRFRNGRNAKLYDVFFRLLENNIKANVSGLDVQQLVDSVLPDSISDTWDKTPAYAISKVLMKHVQEQIAVMEQKKWINAAKDYLADALKVQRLIEISSATSYNCFVDYIKSLSFQQQDGVTCSTIHTAKGLEWNQTFVIDAYAFPYSGKTDEEKMQEANVHYVALSRSKDTMYLTQ